MRSISEDTAHSVLIQAKNEGNNLLFVIPFISEPIPIGIFFKALGLNVKEICEVCGLTNGKADEYVRAMINNSCIVESSHVTEFENDQSRTEDVQRRSLLYMSNHTQYTNHDNETSVKYINNILYNELFPHMGITATRREIIILLGCIIKKLFHTIIGERKADDRDNYANKRIDTPGILCHDLFKQLFKKFTDSIKVAISKRKQVPDIISILSKQTEITKGFKYCFGTGNWGVIKNNYVRSGVAQILSRLSFGATISNLRRIAIPVGKELKNAAIRQINPSQIMFICPSETPEGGSVGIVMNLALCTRFSVKIPTVIVKEIIESCKNLIPISDQNNITKVFLNGIIMGMTNNVEELKKELYRQRLRNRLHWSVSIVYDSVDDELVISSDAGRLLRPVLTIDENNKLNLTSNDSTNWDILIDQNKIQYIDVKEANQSIIAFNPTDIEKYRSDFCEIAPAMMLGVMGSIIPFRITLNHLAIVIRHLWVNRQ